MADSYTLLPASRSARAAIYARVSTDMQTERFGLDLQRHECRQYAAHHGYAVVREYIEGGGTHSVSGAITTREQTTAILSDLQQHPGLFTLLILYDTSRLARDDSGVFGRWYYVQGGYGNDPEGQLLKRIKQDFDTYERQRLAVRDRAGMAARARSGLWNGGYAPFGYDLKDGRIVLNPEEAEVVQEIFRLYAEVGLNVDQIGERLYQLGVPGKWEHAGTKHRLRRVSSWYPSTVFRILTNTAYLGRAIWGTKKNPRP